jgi:precorrin-2 dehydrogenase/sirohydrochlorin ferrochelatase/precorrin-6A/cobalt-precorrin-6A reductase
MGIFYNIPMKTFFPLFIDMSGRHALVIGGGNIAERRVKTLAGFGAEITVISPNVSEYIEGAANRLIKREYEKGDICELKPFIVIAAADKRNVNHEATLEAKKLNIYVSVADCREECTFYFPAIAENEDYIAGLVSKNGKHSRLKEMAKKVRELFL